MAVERNLCPEGREIWPPSSLGVRRTAEQYGGRSFWSVMGFLLVLHHTISITPQFRFWII